MFKISTKGDYGLLLLTALAEKTSAGRKFVSLKEIADEKKLSLPYISRIIIPLKDAGLVESKEGRDGGYRLSKSPEKITIMEILELLEGPVAPVRCCEKKTAKCGSETFCNVKHTWLAAKILLAKFLRNTTLADTIPNAKLKVRNSKTQQNKASHS